MVLARQDKIEQIEVNDPTVTPKMVPLKILVVEDSESTRIVLAKKLGEWGYEVTACDDGDGALALVNKQGFDLIITDWIMPGVDGMELIRQIRKLKREPLTYIIVLTGMSEKEDLLYALETGADDYLTKPFDFGELRARIRTASRIAHLERQLSSRKP